jgi:hypothetical protein
LACITCQASGYFLAFFLKIVSLYKNKWNSTEISTLHVYTRSSVRMLMYVYFSIACVRLCRLGSIGKLQLNELQLGPSWAGARLYCCLQIFLELRSCYKSFFHCHRPLINFVWGYSKSPRTSCSKSVLFVVFYVWGYNLFRDDIKYILKYLPIFKILINIYHMYYLLLIYALLSMHVRFH